MIKIIIKKNKGPVPYEAKGFRSGFVILFAVTLSAIFLAIALGISNIALKEVKFGTSARDTNDAFFAADTGAECAQYYDRTPGPPNNYPNAFSDNPPAFMICADVEIPTPEADPEDFWTFTVLGLGRGEQGCAIVTVDKITPEETHIISKGYNLGGDGSCESSSTNLIEREINVDY
ncbi:hypothetical protein A2917_02155 [Candidatus Nomurabacteria bacterium RIFCSPLOWO2_01_FULL_42_17]|uniref:Type 4 fimbrial biogenesis protein PilX N-terminal domain-containing protein n=1 Tax=Candidatus Nomurabacteria bacterium RIFCSPLOWO2_01_FULL_42_17 TaxID=1801780 RepID=A0A1F6XMK4_9BACT|nr:MAG: hypothetical protein A2917_02155 [Candidatus Nomurabacteria bacterium RIFCSPLOWO2_01_FULL_42_17]